MNEFSLQIEVRFENVLKVKWIMEYEYISIQNGYDNSNIWKYLKDSLFMYMRMASKINIPFKLWKPEFNLIVTLNLLLFSFNRVRIHAYWVSTVKIRSVML